MIPLTVNDWHEHSQATLEENTVSGTCHVCVGLYHWNSKRQKHSFDTEDWEPSFGGEI